MAIEIEKKFLVKPDRLPPLNDGKKIVQGYLSEQPMIRFRFVDDKIILAVKSLQADGSRFELETEKNGASEAECLALQNMASYPVVIKTRYCVKHEDLVWEIDVYEGANKGLITVDVELPRLNYPIIFPDWVDSNSDIRSYLNISTSIWEKGPILLGKKSMEFQRTQNGLFPYLGSFLE